jgi:hypothetical protein
MRFKRNAVPLSPELVEVWGFVPIRHLIHATPNYIVFLDEGLAVDWKSTVDHDAKHAHQRDKFSAILNKAAVIESSDWDGSDDQKTLNLKRQIGEAIARGLDGDYSNAEQMLISAENYRERMLGLVRRSRAINEQVKIKERWRNGFRRWTAVHYLIGIAAILLSTLVASKAPWLNETQLSVAAWLVAVTTGLLTFLAPEKKADRYIRAWSVLNTEITRYNVNERTTVDDVLDAYHSAEKLIHDSSSADKGSSRGRR